MAALMMTCYHSVRLIITCLNYHRRLRSKVNAHILL